MAATTHLIGASADNHIKLGELADAVHSLRVRAQFNEAADEGQRPRYPRKYTVTVVETVVDTKFKSVHARSLEEAQEKAQDEFAREYRHDGIGGAYECVVVKVEPAED